MISWSAVKAVRMTGVEELFSLAWPAMHRLVLGSGTGMFDESVVWSPCVQEALKSTS